jgi:hypothetical protein
MRNIVLCFEKAATAGIGSEVKMAVEDKEKKAKARTEEQPAAPAAEETASTEDYPNELRLPVWSVVSFEKCEASGLIYMEAEEKLAALEARKVSGLCIVTDEVAARINEKN